MRRSHLWILVSVVVLAVVVTLVLVLVLPSSNSNSGEAETAEETASGDSSNDQSGATQDQGGGHEAALTPGGTENGSPDVVVNFPDPAVDGGETPSDENPSGDEQPQIYGAWIIDMTGSDYGLTNLHISLEKEGNVTSPGDYQNIFEITQSHYDWDSGSLDFSASIQLTLKLGAGQTTIPVSIELNGKVSESLAEIEGNFSAVPQVEVFAPYSQQGTFKMYK